MRLRRSIRRIRSRKGRRCMQSKGTHSIIMVTILFSLPPKTQFHFCDFIELRFSSVTLHCFVLVVETSILAKENI
jgi:hypothetical protein